MPSHVRAQRSLAAGTGTTVVSANRPLRNHQHNHRDEQICTSLLEKFIPKTKRPGPKSFWDRKQPMSEFQAPETSLFD
ncbi:hypothetical protein J6590_004278 [Homalodisca vitripennis]|nr:hypothetical protein J6590_004278 [Homalodisca vitripennis]